ncbi:protein BIG GRAIN 1-like E [Primulina huaijiensis]|uniref:protein BIG GRAIN 1-like E n=1 Tax=Primulina huaijiensis TaxID=1492673 RepID=UPI003CC75FBA
MLYYLFTLQIILNALQTSSYISTNTMSVVKGLSSSDSCRNPFQRRNDSGELDVFEAARYFSGANENPAYVYAAKYDQYFIKNGTRVSPDMPRRGSSITHDHSLEKQIMKENKKYKQPSSPGARLASFLNSLFNQKSLKKKKKQKSSGKINDIEDENPGGLRRKRRNSLGHFPVTNVASFGPDWRSSFSASNSVFTTPHATTPTKSCKELVRSDYFRPGTVKINELHNEKRSTNYDWIDERFSFRNGISEKTSRNGSSFEFSGHGIRFATTWGFHDSSSEGREISKSSDADDHGAESDSSSDLFDLPNYGSNFCSRTDLPVYETTKLDRIKRSSLIANAATVP